MNIEEYSRPVEEDDFPEVTAEAEEAWERKTMGAWMGLEGSWVECTPELKTITTEPAC